MSIRSNPAAFISLFSLSAGPSSGLQRKLVKKTFDKLDVLFSVIVFCGLELVTVRYCKNTEIYDVMVAGVCLLSLFCAIFGGKEQSIWTSDIF